MGKSPGILILAVVSLGLFVACNGSGPAAVTIDASQMTGSWVNVPNGAHIRIENLSDDHFYAIRTVGSSRSVDVSRVAITEENVFKGNDNTFIPVPDAEHKVEFSMNDLEIQGSGSIQLVYVRIGEDDMTIDSSKDIVSYYTEGGSKVFDEYYHIDFSKAPYNGLDKSRIALLAYSVGSGSGSASWGYVTLGKGGMEPAGYTSGLYDFSDKETVNLYNTLRLDSSTSRWKQKMVIMNPVSCAPNIASDIISSVGVYSIGPVDDGQSYVVEILKEPGFTYSDNINVRYIDGDIAPFSYKLFTSNEKDVHFIGKLDAELLVNVMMDIGGYQGNDFGKVLFRPATEAESQQVAEHVVWFGSDEETVFETRVSGYDFNEYEFMVYSEDHRTLNNMNVKVEYQYDSGVYIEGGCYTLVTSRNMGNSKTRMTRLYGSCIEYPLTSFLDLQKLSVQVADTEDVNVRITFTRSLENVTDAHDRDGKGYLYIVPNNGEAVKCIRTEIGGKYTVTALEREGYDFRCLYYNGIPYYKGDQITIDNIYMAVTAAWDAIALE